MTITSKTSAIATDIDREGRQGLASVSPSVNGFVFGILMLTGEFYLARKDGGNFIVAIPSESWLQDLKDDGYEIVQSLTRNEAPKQ